MLENGEVLFPVEIAYETYGTLNQDRSNAILITHAFSGDAHAAGYHTGDSKPGWWDNMIGPGKAFDTEKYFIICSNVLGGCMGSTGPASINPATGKRYGLTFPQMTIGDMVNAQARLIEYLGIEKLLSVAGGSMGGMQVLQWMAAYPNRIHSAIPIATTSRHSPQQIAFNEVGRQAIMADPSWDNGDYYEHEPPARGLSVARMVGHITYMSDISMGDKFGRRRNKTGNAETKFTPVFEVEGYLKYRGDSFVHRFDPNSYLYITKAMDLFDLAGEKMLPEILRGIEVKVLVLSYKSDWLYPTYQSQELVRACKIAGVETTYVEVDSTYGHDAFLLETDRQSVLISHFLATVTSDLLEEDE
ncbi:MAG: homoserine O-acetyltransferase [Leptospiraceae bacterium]|nr:homoserine O-acetyltransferase [Leptospiraceae bacterium]MCB1202333.1 homoserine O-acetyltransferase [Leptospiraceae bacterium]